MFAYCISSTNRNIHLFRLILIRYQFYFSFVSIFYYYFFFCLFSVAEDEAAKKIQAVFRGHKVRASMKKGDTSSSVSATAKTTATSAASNNAAVAESEQTKEELEAEFREDDKGKLKSNTL